MAPIEILDDLFFIERGFLSGNHFVYRSQDPILIDTAHITDFDTTKQAINGLGVELTSVRLIVNTHTHCDHIGGNKFIQDASGCDIALHKIGKHFIDTHDDWSTWWRYFGQQAAFFTCTTTLEDGEIISIGPHKFEVIYTPGHASDGIVLYNQKEKILISSDALWPKDMGAVVTRIEGSRALFDMAASLDKLAALDVKIAYPGHGSPFTDITEAIARARQKIDTFMGNKEKLGRDLIKKIIVYTLLEHKAISEKTFFIHLMTSHWFKENIDFHFGKSRYETIYNEILSDLYQRGIIQRQNGKFVTTVKP